MSVESSKVIKYYSPWKWIGSQMGGSELLSQTKKGGFPQFLGSTLCFLTTTEHHSASVSALVVCSMSRTSYLSQLIPWNSSPIAAGPLPPWSCLQLPTLWPGQERLLAGRDWEFICVLVADVLSSASSKSTTVSGQLLLMSRPLWPEDAETLCPSVPLHMRHVLVPLHLVSHFYLASACLMSCHVCRLTSSRSSSSFYVRHICSPTTLSFHPSSSSTQQLQTWRYPAPYHRDAWPPASALCSPPLWHNVMIAAAAAALRLISRLLMVKKENTLTRPVVWRSIFFFFLSLVKKLEPRLRLYLWRPPPGQRCTGTHHPHKRQ